MITGYRKVIAALHQNPRAGSLGLAFFVTALIYSLSEAGFRMQTPTWIFLLLAVVSASHNRASEVLISSSTDEDSRSKKRRARALPTNQRTKENIICTS
jgi:hypothetical protein